VAVAVREVGIGTFITKTYIASRAFYPSVLQALIVFALDTLEGFHFVDYDTRLAKKSVTITFKERLLFASAIIANTTVAIG
jgi:hypothetical protein